MLLKDIKVSALRLIVGNDTETINADTLESLYNDSNYGSYLNAMNDSINRCFSDIETKGNIPDKTLDLGEGTVLASGLTMFDLSSALSGIVKNTDKNFPRIERLIETDENNIYIRDVDFARSVTEDKIYISEKNEQNGVTHYVLIYKPKIPRLTDESNDNSEIDLPDDILSLIPHYIKGDLYRDDEPGEAGEARNWYEQGMGALNSGKERESVYNMVDL